MITVEEALQTIGQHTKDFGTRKVPLNEATGRVLKEDLFTDRALPPYDRVTMDGIAIQYAAFESGQKTFSIAGIAPAGAPQISLKNDRQCLEVMTGSILPQNVDTVIRYENLDIANGCATIQMAHLKKGQNVHRKGEDRAKNSLVVSKNTLISSAEISLAATIGKTHLEVARLPKTMIISTGDELVPIGKKPLPHQIRKSNVHCLKATLLQYGMVADTHHLDDNFEQIKKDLKKIIDQYEVVLLSGGVSKGKFDFLPTALDALEVQKLFYKIKQRPGKPFWFGKAKNGALIFALPGNPISSFLCTQYYFVSWLINSLGLSEKTPPYGILTADYTFKPDLVYFLQVKIGYNNKGQIVASPISGHGSGDLANLVDADAFIQLPRGKDLFKKGEAYPLIFYRNKI